MKYTINESQVQELVTKFLDLRQYKVSSRKLLKDLTIYYIFEEKNTRYASLLLEVHHYDDAPDSCRLTLSSTFVDKIKNFFSLSSTNDAKAFIVAWFSKKVDKPIKLTHTTIVTAASDYLYNPGIPEV